MFDSTITRHWRRGRQAVAVLAAASLALVACDGGGDATGPEDPPPVEEPNFRSLDIERAEGGGTKGVRRSAFSGAFAGYDVRGISRGGHRGRMYAETLVGLGINEHPTATSFVYNTWSSEPGRYSVSADFRWKGFLYGAGVAGTGAGVTMWLKIFDFQGTLLAQEMIHEKELREGSLTLGGVKDEGSTSVVVDFTLPSGTGGPFRIQFEHTCESYSGLISAEAGCLYGNGDVAKKVGLDGYAEWTKLSVTQFFD